MRPAKLWHFLLPMLLTAAVQPANAGALRHAVESQQAMAALPSSAWDDQDTGPVIIGGSQSTGSDTFRLDTATPAAGLDARAQAVTPSSSDTSTDSHSPLPELPTAPQQDLRHELWQQWGEKFALLQQENIALRDQLNRVQQDTISDIRVDSPTTIENETLRNRVAELEKEVETLRSKANDHKAAKDVNSMGGQSSGPGSTGLPLARTHAE